jgi:nucleotide-binding universal stress UspA family protein
MPQSALSSESGYTSIMVPMDLSPEASNRLRLATALAGRFSSRLLGVAAQPIVSPFYFEGPADGVASIIELEEKAAKKQLATAESIFNQITGTAKQREWRQAFGNPTDHALTHARAADLIVVGSPADIQGEYASMCVDGGDVVMGAGRPVLFVPLGVDFVSAKRIVIGWKDTREARRAVWDSLPLLTGAQEVFVASDKANTEGAKDVVLYLQQHKVTAYSVAGLEQEGTIADDLVRIAQRERADLIVAGAYGHSRTREWVFGGATKGLIEDSPLCCLMAH